MAAQLAGALVLMPLLALVPSTGGALWLIPLSQDVPVAREAIAQGGLILDRGPGRTLIVRGPIALFDWALLRRGVVAVGAPAMICGARP